MRELTGNAFLDVILFGVLTLALFAVSLALIALLMEIFGYFAVKLFRRPPRTPNDWGPRP